MLCKSFYNMNTEQDIAQIIVKFKKMKVYQPSCKKFSDEPETLDLNYARRII